MLQEVRQSPSVLTLDIPYSIPTFTRDAALLRQGAMAGYGSVAEALQLQKPTFSGLFKQDDAPEL